MFVRHMTGNLDGQSPARVPLGYGSISYVTEGGNLPKAISLTALCKTF